MKTYNHIWSNTLELLNFCLTYFVVEVNKKRKKKEKKIEGFWLTVREMKEYYYFIIECVENQSSYCFLF